MATLRGHFSTTNIHYLQTYLYQIHKNNQIILSLSPYSILYICIPRFLLS